MSDYERELRHEAWKEQNTMKDIPPRFLAGSPEPATAYTVAELRELLQELPGGMLIHVQDGIACELAARDGWVELRTISRHADGDDGSAETFAAAQQLLADLAAAVEALADPDGDFDLDTVELRHEMGGEG